MNNDWEKEFSKFVEGESAVKTQAWYMFIRSQRQDLLKELRGGVEGMNPIAVSGDDKPPYRLDWIKKADVIKLLEKYEEK